MYLTTFATVAVGTTFTHNETTYVKRSSRTAGLTEHPSRWFYFSARDTVEVR